MKSKPRLVIEHNDEKLILKFRIKCIKLGTTMRAVVLQFIKNFVKGKE